MGDSLYASTILSMEEEQRKKGPQLNDQQWVLQRKKIGLSRRSKKTREAREHAEESKAQTIAFYQSNFSRRDCVQYVHNDTPGRIRLHLQNNVVMLHFVTMGLLL